VERTFRSGPFCLGCRVVDASGEAGVVNSRRAAIRLDPQAEQHLTILIAVATGHEADDPRAAAKVLLDRAERDLDQLYPVHQQWWSDFWRRSFVRLQSDYVENLYYFRRYLMASGSRGPCLIQFNGGIWLWNHDVRNWNSPHWWNQQATYFGLGASNDSDLLLPLLDVYWRFQPAAHAYAKGFGGSAEALLINEMHTYLGLMGGIGPHARNFTPASQVGRFFWNYYAYTGDRAFLKNHAYPFMKAAAQFYLDYLTWDEAAGAYRIDKAKPCECAMGVFSNTITDLGMIRFSFSKLVEASVLLDIDTDKRGKWQHVLDHLWEPPRTDWPDVGEVFTFAFDKTGKPWPTGDDCGC